MKGIWRIKKAYHTVKRRFKRRPVILMYHRIADSSSDPWELAVSPQHFAQHLEYLKRTCHPMRLLDLADAIPQRSLPRRAVAITFDDGYVDNFVQARPLLEAVQIPATIFVATGYIDSRREFWWDELERVLLSLAHLPECLRINLQGREREWLITSAEQRQLAYNAVHGLLRTLSAAERDEVLADLASWAGLESLERTARPGYRPMTTSELIQVARHDLLDLGAHTITHPALSSLSLDAQRAEIIGSRERLQAVSGSEVLTFSYPYHDHTLGTTEIVKAAGFRAAVSGWVESDGDLFRLQRFQVSNWDILTFRRQLDAFFAEVNSRD